MDKFKIITVLILLAWSSPVAFGLRVAVRQKNRPSMVMLSIAAFYLGCLWLLFMYEVVLNFKTIGIEDDCGFLFLIPSIITILCTIFGLVALVKEEDDRGET